MHGIQLIYSKTTTLNCCDKTQRTDGHTEKTAIQVITMAASDKSKVKTAMGSLTNL